MRKAGADDVAQIGRTLARAFRDDPAIAWAFADGERRERLLPRYFELLVRRVYLPRGEVYVTGDRMGAAVWVPPGEWEVPTIGAQPSRSQQMAEVMEQVHSRHAEPHYYLPYVGTDPAARRRGRGTALLRHVLDRCDAEGIPAYLEATSPANLALYARLGFTVVEELRWPDGGPPFWPMWRTPG